MNPLEIYIRNLYEIHSSNAGVKETSYYGTLENLLNEIGKTLKPRVRCIINLRNRGVGIPDGGLFTANQFQRNSDPEPFVAINPERGVIEAKGTKEDAWVVAKSEQVDRYWQKYRQVLVTNYRDFVLIGQDTNGKKIELESYRLAASEADFWTNAAKPNSLEEHKDRFIEFLKRVMLQAASITSPADVAWFLASYARDAKSRIEQHTTLPALTAIRTALEEALGVRFEGEKGDRFFRSTLVQTLFYGIFSAWVLWHKENPSRQDNFDWKTAAYYLHVPMIQALFYQVSDPRRLKALDLVEVLNWTGTVLNRVRREEFFKKFDEGQAVQYFYEPFLQAFDPELRKELGVWYTPPEIVQYMVARVDTVLREELDIEDGLANKNVYILDPCCGTGAYLVEVLKHIAATLKDKGEDALGSSDVKEAAIKRVFGFEILTAPFVVAHLQLGLLLQNLGVPLSDENERVGVYLTNALTGWEPPKEPKQLLLFPELEEERDAADKVKREKPILVILGNPPYYGFSGLAMGEERDLSNAYRTTKHAPAPQGQGLNDLYVRFFRMAERRIVEQTGKGVVCFISNYSWLDGLSFPGMRERYLEVFDKIWIDCLNGDKFKTGKITPEGEPDPSIFSTEWNKEGIQVGTAIALFTRKKPHADANLVRFRHLWGKKKRSQLLETVVQDGESLYQPLHPYLDLGLPYVPLEFNLDYSNWLLLTEIFPVSFPGVKTSRDNVVVDIDHDRLMQRMEQYFDPKISHEEIGRICPRAMQKTPRFEAKSVRDYLLKRGFLPQYIVRYCYRPFDVRWVYWEPETKLLDEKITAYFPHLADENVWIVSQQKPRREWSKPQVIRSIGCLDLMDRGASCIPLYLQPKQNQNSLFPDNSPSLVNGIKFNISDAAVKYLTNIGTIEDAENLFYNTLAILHAPVYAIENAGALRQDWPRIPLPNNQATLRASAELGKQIAALLDTETPVVGVTSGKISAELKAIAIISRVGNGQLNPEAGDLSITANWGHAGQKGVTMPGKGKIITRPYTPEELTCIEEGAVNLAIATENAVAQLGKTTCDIYLNDIAYWKNIPTNVWNYTIGGYQVIKKWLSYREEKLLGRSLTKEEVREVTNMTRRIAAILLLEPKLDANYTLVKQSTYNIKSV